ncbi:MAG: TraB/GumN family protein [Ferruginibacter sp.]|nr:TraB/GumN family protein [Cytophagales bacterium]
MKISQSRRTRPLAFLLLLIGWQAPAFAQPRAAKPARGGQTENAVLWEVSGKGLSQPSYLFGTFHLLTSDYLKTLPKVAEKLGLSGAVAGEVVMDSTVMMKLLPASMMSGTTLDQLLKPEEYQLTADYFKEVSGMDLKMLNSFKPMALQAAIIQFEWNKLNPTPYKNGPAMDSYFQQEAKAQGKTVVGLETVEDQIRALFDQFSLERQAAMLVESVKEKEKSREEMLKMAQCYQAQDLVCLQRMVYDPDNFRPEEMKTLLHDRNAAWMKKIPDLMQAKPTFIAVGAGHLVGEQGLISLLRQRGYAVKPL